MSYSNLGSLGIDCPPGGVPDPLGLTCIPSGVLTSGGGKFTCPPGSQVDPSGLACMPIPSGTPGSTGQTTSSGLPGATVPLPGGASWLPQLPGSQTAGGSSSTEQYQTLPVGTWFGNLFGGGQQPSNQQSGVIKGVPKTTANVPPTTQQGVPAPDLSELFRTFYGMLPPPGTPLVMPGPPAVVPRQPEKTPAQQALSSPLLWGALALGAAGLAFFVYKSSKQQG